MAIQTKVTAYRTSAEVTAPAANGAYCHGFLLEGAAWETGTE